jgi:hypothetical protein
MNDGHLNRQHRLQYVVRGPEWAFAIPQGDMDALEDVMRRCSTFWNGAGSLIIPVTSNGRIDPAFRDMLETRSVDACFAHERLSTRAREAALKLVGSVHPLYGGFDQGEIHPLLFAEQPSDTALKPSVLVPRFESAELRRVALAAWGYIHDEDVPHWRARFNIAEFAGEAAFRALITGQVGFSSTSPLALGTTHMNLIEQRNTQDWPYVYVFDKVTFRRLTVFWNVRARLVTLGTGAPVVALPRQALAYPQHLESIRRWGASPDWGQRTPDFLVAGSQETSEAIDAAFGAIGLDRDRGNQLSYSLGSGTERRDRPTYRYMGLRLGGRFLRGIHADDLIAFAEGASSLSLAAPAGLPLRGHNMRVMLRTLPLPFPVTASAARRIDRNAVADSGVMLTLAAYGRWNVDIRLPGAWEALQDWAGDHGYTVRLSQPGRYGNAILSRLQALDRLEILADDLRVQVLKRLTPESRPKLAQRLAATLPEDSSADERQLAEHLAARIADIGLFLEVESRPAADIAGLLGKPKRAVLAALAPLVQAGLVQRGRTTACPRCNFTAFAPLDAVAETMTCRACRETFVLPVIDAGGNEPPTTYQLDGLAARVMDQDILPVLLTLRALRRTLGNPDLFFCWPGVEFQHGSIDVETDLLVSIGDQVYVSEVKSTAENLDREQLESLLALAEATEARPVIGGLDGTFDSTMAEAVRSVGGHVFERADLLA